VGLYNRGRAKRGVTGDDSFTAGYMEALAKEQSKVSLKKISWGLQGPAYATYYGLVGVLGYTLKNSIAFLTRQSVTPHSLAYPLTCRKPGFKS
jgi:hypothetical protein